MSSNKLLFVTLLMAAVAFTACGDSNPSPDEDAHDNGGGLGDVSYDNEDVQGGPDQDTNDPSPDNIDVPPDETPGCEDGQCIEEIHDPCQDADCDDGEVCDDCEIEDPCKDVTCDDGQHCEDGECVPDAVSSCDDVVCGPDTYCEEGICVPNGLILCDGIVCAPGEACREGKCISGEEACATVVCGDKMMCVAGECVPDGSDLCVGVTCGANEICHDGRCVESDLLPCLGVQCPDGFVCIAGECEDMTVVVDLPEPEGNIVPNWDFELWSGSLPTSWLAAHDTLYVAKNSTSPKSRQFAVHLERDGTNNGRLESSPLTPPVGRYDCTAWAKGNGNVTFGARLSETDDPRKGTYKYAGRQTLWEQSIYRRYAFDFNVTASVKTVTILITTNNSGAPGVDVDAISCVRRPGSCDNVTCDPWEECKTSDGQCHPLAGRCNDGPDCAKWQSCDLESHTCVLAEGRCLSNLDCGGDKPKCDRSTLTCVAGDPCAGVECSDWTECEPASGTCRLKDGRCHTSKDCLQGLPACDGATHTCESASHASNIFPNGGFEAWDEYTVPYYQGTYWLPDYWYGIDFSEHDGKFETEIAPDAIKRYTTSTHSGNYALQIVFPEGVADRFTSEAFDIPAGSYTCSFWVRGKGSVRHHSYSTGGEMPHLPFMDIDTTEWQRVSFNIRSNVRYFRMIFYVSNTDSSKDHIQIDDVVCTKDVL
ncbi:MAG TPA: hypothetical protein PK329_10290 [Myxococcota bacterium]|nr:hypothetical protein [Myxococcota bacterium]HON26348.1 hypothetical protein [Myxococcota bacterium]HOS62872.1 hypothetical protein [Myxococcota bacterium]HPC92774.1 hypothetical protein [Myxococcota bacterium]HQE74600.1 hypothetical protein [Myxococcota bacterium]